MSSAEVKDAPLVDWSGDAYRLIPSRFPPVNVYAGLIGEDRLEEVFAAENLTNPRLRSQQRLASVSKGDADAEPRLQNWNLAPFAYGNPDGTLFFDENRPCLELSIERQTALAVSVAMRERFLAATDEAPIGLDMRMLCHPVEGKFYDLRKLTRNPGRLDSKARREIGARIPADAQGLLYHPEERPAATCLAVLAGQVLQRSAQTAHFRYVWDGAKIVRLYAFDKSGTEIETVGLAGSADVLAAA